LVWIISLDQSNALFQIAEDLLSESTEESDVESTPSVRDESLLPCLTYTIFDDDGRFLLCDRV